MEQVVEIGSFNVNGSSLSGKLTLNRRNTKLFLYSDTPIDGHAIENAYIEGVFSNNKKVSLIDCLVIGKGYTGDSDSRKHYVIIFPHYVIIGHEHIKSPEEKIFKEITYTIENNTTLFHDYDVFGHVFSSPDATKTFLESYSKQSTRPFELGDRAELYYYSGKFEIFKVDSCIGTISAIHLPTIQLPSASGIRIDNSIPLKVKFDSSKNFKDAIGCLYKTKPFINLIMGRDEAITNVSLYLHNDDNSYEPPLDVYICMLKVSTSSEKPPHPIDILINGGEHPEKFSSVLSSWLERYESWKDSRLRFNDSAFKNNAYTIDRLVAAANIFDILPNDSVGEPTVLSEAMQLAVAECKSILKSQKQNGVRDSLLGALGRVNRHNLKTKVKARANLLTEFIQNRLPDLERVINESINTRNYFVHGTEGRLSVNDRYSLTGFFTDTLEFIFGASDLIESGWDIDGWLKQGSTLSHPFALYIHNYNIGYQRLIEALDS